MAKTMTIETRQAIEKARAEKAATRQNRLSVGGWHIFRIDPLNVVLQKGEDGDPCYYPDVPSALTSLFRRMTDPTARQDLAAHARLVEKAERAIVEAVGRAGGLQGLFAGAGEGAA